MLIDNGWVYLDMKPDNLGTLQEKIMIIDTDPISFYMIPEKHRPFYRECCHMIILLFCYNYFPTIDVLVLKEFIHLRGYSIKSFDKLCNDAAVKNTDFFSNTIMSHNRINKNKLYDLNLPLLYIEHYGKKYITETNFQDHRVRFQLLMNDVTTSKNTLRNSTGSISLNSPNSSGRSPRPSVSNSKPKGTSI